MTLLQETIVREFLAQDEANKEREARGEAIVPIMPKDLANRVGCNDATVRKVLRDRGLWEPRHHDAATIETLRRINVGRQANNFKSLAAQRAAGFPNLKKGRAKLAQKNAARKKQQSAERASVNA